MARLIDAEALKNMWLKDKNTMLEHGFSIGTDILDGFIRDLDNAPTVEPKHGHWIEVQRIHETDHTAICECSLCGDTVWVYDGQRAWNYCPTCGAKMDEVET